MKPIWRLLYSIENIWLNVCRTLRGIPILYQARTFDYAYSLMVFGWHLKEVLKNIERDKYHDWDRNTVRKLKWVIELIDRQIGYPERVPFWHKLYMDEQLNRFIEELHSSDTFSFSSERRHKVVREHIRKVEEQERLQLYSLLAKYSSHWWT